MCIVLLRVTEKSFHLYWPTLVAEFAPSVAGALDPAVLARKLPRSIGALADG